MGDEHAETGGLSGAAGEAAAVPAAAAGADEAPAAGEAAGAGDGRPAWTGPSLSPSRAGDFLTCPLLYRFRVIDRLPEPPSPVAVRGTLVHAVLERLFDRPAADRTPESARSMVTPEWERLREANPELAGLFDGDDELAEWLAQAGEMLDRYFTLEDPQRLEPAHRELSVAAVLSSGLRLRGYIDRLDVAPGGEIRIVDYKTGNAPPEVFEARALFQMRFYALVLWRAEGRVPRLLQLMYLGSGEIIRYQPDEADLLATERKVEALWQAIERASESQDWRPRPGRICDWCAHKPICPAHGGTPPPLPPDRHAEAALAPGEPEVPAGLPAGEPAVPAGLPAGEPAVVAAGPGPGGPAEAAPGTPSPPQVPAGRSAAEGEPTAPAGARH
jgi:putative RecB family exonuclease